MAPSPYDLSCWCDVKHKHNKFSDITQLNMKLIMFIKVKMPLIVGILTFISMKDTRSESLKARKVIIFQHFRFYEQLKFNAQFLMSTKITSTTLGLGLNFIITR